MELGVELLHALQPRHGEQLGVGIGHERGFGATENAFVVEIVDQPRIVLVEQSLDAAFELQMARRAVRQRPGHDAAQQQGHAQPDQPIDGAHHHALCRDRAGLRFLTLHCGPRGVRARCWDRRTSHGRTIRREKPRRCSPRIGDADFPPPSLPGIRAKQACGAMVGARRGRHASVGRATSGCSHWPGRR